MLKRLFSRKSADVTAQDPLAAFLKVFQSTMQSSSGRSVTLETAFQVSVLFACLRVLGEGVAQVPWELCQETDTGISVLPQRLPAKKHPLYRVLKRRPNVWQDTFQFRECITWHAALMGGAYIYINRVGLSKKSMRVAELIPLDPTKHVETRQLADYTLEFGFRGKDGLTKWFPQESIWYLRGPSWDGVNAIKVIKAARDALGLAMATEDAHAKLHANGVSPSGLYTVEGKLEPKAYEDLKKWIEREYGGNENKGKPMILDMNAKFVPNVMTGVDAQHLETRRHQIEEICRWFRMMSIMIGHSDKAATFASAEVMVLAHLTHCLMPWYARIEASADFSLLTDDEVDAGFYTKFRERALLRGSMQATSDYLTKLKNAGIITANEARADLDRNPLEDGDELSVSSSPAAAPQGNEDPSATPKD